MAFQWRDADDETLERHFNPRVAVADVQALIDGLSVKAAAARRHIRGWYDFRYGPNRLETYDVHPPTVDRLGSPAPILIFIHGGFWRALDKSDHSWAAPVFVGAGLLVINLNYHLCPEVTLDDIVGETRRAVVHLHNQASALGGDKDRIFVVGHSAGAHLAGMLANFDWTLAGLPIDTIKGIGCISGIYEPEVVMRTSVNADVRLDAATAQRNDCIAQPPRRPLPTIVTVGGEEPAGWRQQSLDYAEACRRAGCPVEYLEVEGTNHFTVAEELTRRDSATTKAILKAVAALPHPI